MRIGSDNSSISLKKVSQEGSATVWRIEATTSGAGWKFAVFHDRIGLHAAGETRQAVADFSSHRLQRLEVTLSEGGWLRVKRVPAGYVLVRYRVGQLSIGSAVEGEVILEPEAGETFCRRLGALL